MYLTELEHEAFLRGRAAGLIPADVPLPTCDKEIDELILHVGFLFSRRIAYRNRQKKLRLKKQNKNNKSCLRKYIEGCSAAKLYSLYLFDNRIR